MTTPEFLFNALCRQIDQIDCIENTSVWREGETRGKTYRFERDTLGRDDAEETAESCLNVAFPPGAQLPGGLYVSDLCTAKVDYYFNSCDISIYDRKALNPAFYICLQ